MGLSQICRRGRDPGFPSLEFSSNWAIPCSNPRDRVSPSPVASAESAANEIVNALRRRKREQIVTFHGKVAVFLERHFPWIVAALAGTVDADRRHDRKARSASAG